METTAVPTAPDNAWGLPADRVNGVIAAWLDRCEADHVHPGVVMERLRRAGWHPAQAAAAGEAYRRRFDEHTLGYSVLLVATGVAALAAGSAGHVLAAGLDGPVNRNALADWLTVVVCSLPFAVWAHWWAATVDREDPAAVWSRPRRSLAGALLWGCGIVGVARLMLYAGSLIGSLVGATWALDSSPGAGALNVLITTVIALPLGLWAFRFRHRFDDEDPTAPALHRRANRH